MTIRPRIEDIVKHRDTFLLFYRYLKHTHAEEALNFWVEAELYQRISRRTDLSPRAKEIYNKYLKDDSFREVNVDGSLRTQLAESITNADKQGAWGDPHRNLFVPIQAVVLDLLSNSSLSAFLATKEYKKLQSGSLRNVSSHLHVRSLTKIAKRSRSQTMEVFDKYFDLLEDKAKNDLWKIHVSVSSGEKPSLPTIKEDTPNAPKKNTSSLKFPSKPLPAKPLPQPPKPLPPVPTKSSSQLSLSTATAATDAVGEETAVNGQENSFKDIEDATNKTYNQMLYRRMTYVRPRSISILMAAQNDSETMAATTPKQNTRGLCNKWSAPPLQNAEEEEREKKTACGVDDGVRVLEALDIDSMVAQLQL